MDARNNLANQEVFHIAKAADKEGTRTVGIMTKCDAVQKGDEHAVSHTTIYFQFLYIYSCAPKAVKIAQNLTEKLIHGWFCVRNRSTTEILSGVTMEQRHENERKLFATAPWNVLDKEWVGIASLKRFLGRLLSDHVANEFPAIRKEIDARYTAVRKGLDQLGPPRQNTHEQIQYMIHLAGTYQRKVEDSINGRYFEAGLHPSKLRMHVQKANDEFNTLMHSIGHYYQFQSTAKTLDDALSAVIDGNVEDPIDTSQDHGIDDSNENIYIAIRDLYITSRGTELPGLVNPSVLEVLFARQTVKWVDIAQKYVEKVVSLIQDCNQALFARLSVDERLKTKVLDTISAGMETSITAAEYHLARILSDEREGPLTTINHRFAENLAKARAERVVAGLERLGYQNGQQYRMNFSSLTSVAHLSNEASAVHEIHDVLNAYYKVALERFSDNVINQVVQRNLLGPSGPLTVFAPDWVGNLNPDELAAIAGEDYLTSNTRAELTAQLGRLEQARKICSGRSLGKVAGM